MSKKQWKPPSIPEYDARKMLEEMGTLSRLDVRNLTGRHVENVKPESFEGKGMPKLRNGIIR